MIYLKDAHKEFKVVLFINSKGKVADTFISSNDEKIDDWIEKRRKTSGLFAVHKVGNMIELLPSRGQNTNYT